ncbi:hypothetical protein ACFE04_016815 [Oxalis oulophora]
MASDYAIAQFRFLERLLVVHGHWCYRRIAMILIMTGTCHATMWGSIVLWYIFLLIYGALPSTFSTTAYKVLIEACAPSLLFWLTTIVVVVSALLPFFAYKVFQTRFKPMYHDLIQRSRLEGLEDGRSELPV